MFGAGLLLLLTFTRDEEKIAKVLSKIEWTAIFFFAGLFILVGALVETGVIKMLAAEAMAITQGSVESTAILILWMSAIASAFVDNIPFVATMIPLIKDMGTMGITNLDHCGGLWLWALVWVATVPDWCQCQCSSSFSGSSAWTADFLPGLYEGGLPLHDSLHYHVYCLRISQISYVIA